MDSFSSPPDQEQRGVKRSFEDDEDDISDPDLEALDPRNHRQPQPSTDDEEIPSDSGIGKSTSPPRSSSSFGDEKYKPSTSGLENLTEDLNKPSTSSSHSTDFGPPEEKSFDSGNILDHDDIGLTLPTTTASSMVGLTPKRVRTESSSGAESETDEKKIIDVETCSTSSSPRKSPRKQPDDQKDKKYSDDKIDDDEVTQKSKKERQEEERLRMQVLVSNFSEDQLNRYEMFRRAAFPKAAIKRLMQNITGTTVSHNIVIAMSGISKVFVGEVVETALDIMEKLGETGPLKPKHLREAVRILKHKNSIPSTKYNKKLFR